MVHPLVRYVQRPVHLGKVGDRIFCQHGNAVGIDQFRNSMIDLRVDVVRTSAEDNSGAPCLCQISENFLTLILNVLSHAVEFIKGSTHSVADLRCVNAVFFTQLLKKSWL